MKQMTVGELSSILAKLPADAVVLVHDDEGPDDGLALVKAVEPISVRINDEYCIQRLVEGSVNAVVIDRFER